MLIFPYDNLDDLAVNEVLDLDVPVTYTNLDDMAAGFGNNVENICGERELDLNVSITNEGLHVGAASTDTFQATNVVNDNCDEEFNVSASVSHLSLNDPSASVPLPNDSAPVIANELIENTPLDLRISVTPTQNKETKTSPPSSVEEILNSIVRYTEKDSTPERKRSVRKKLKLPSVMTSQGWIDLKTAEEKEKNDDEMRKKEKKKRIESQRKVKNQFIVFFKNLIFPLIFSHFFLNFYIFQECLEKKDRPNKKLKVDKAEVNPAKASSSEVQPLKVKPKHNTISKIIENPVEVKIGQWAVIEFEEPNTGYRRYIGQIFKAAKGKLYGDFLRPKSTREHNGFVFTYPQVKDISAVSFKQIKKLLPTPDTYGRGLLKFCVGLNVKNL